MAENHLEGPILGFSWDGTGYGRDGTVWGGEALVCEGADFARVAHLRTFPLPGGDKAVRDPRRSVLGLLFELLGREGAQRAIAKLAASSGQEWFAATELKTMSAMLERKVNSPQTSSLGRLFDAVAAICGLSNVITFEAQAAMALEFAADPDEHEAYDIPLSSSAPAVADWGPMIRAMLAGRVAGEPTARISGRFHNALADMALSIAERFAPSEKHIALTGGCFQNALLAERVLARLSEAGFNVYTHRHVPPGDGGIALGQIMVAAKGKKTPCKSGLSNSKM